jgi:hypothetical protein
MVKHFMVAIAAFTLATPCVAFAQYPSYAQPPATAAINDDEQIHGRIVSFDGEYSLGVRDERGFIDTVRLHPGTIINPLGLTLEPGMVVNILGYNAGSYLDANEIDTPYTLYGAIPYYAEHPWNYYGPRISLGFFFGNPGWWHGEHFNGSYHFIGGSRVYNNIHVRDVYNRNIGEFRGHAYVVPRERGGYYPHQNHAVGGHSGGHEERH